MRGADVIAGKGAPRSPEALTAEGPDSRQSLLLGHALDRSCLDHPREDAHPERA
jgi:hypothetical protein